jgi:hypothetical protein
MPNQICKFSAILQHKKEKGKMRKSSMITLAILGVLMVFFAGYGFAVLTTSKEVGSSANVITTVNLSVYDSEVATTELTFIDWQTILPTQVKTKEVWIQNDADISMNIYVTTKDWIPSYANESITFSYIEGKGWSGGMYPKLNPHQRASMIFSLSAGENPPSGSFSFVIVISGVT